MALHFFFKFYFDDVIFVVVVVDNLFQAYKLSCIVVGPFFILIYSRINYINHVNKKKNVFITF